MLVNTISIIIILQKFYTIFSEREHFFMDGRVYFLTKKDKKNKWLLNVCIYIYNRFV